MNDDVTCARSKLMHSNCVIYNLLLMSSSLRRLKSLNGLHFCLIIFTDIT